VRWSDFASNDWKLVAAMQKLFAYPACLLLSSREYCMKCRGYIEFDIEDLGLGA
jgi:hypothetical protein